jgi:hypothetical protein
MSKNKKIWPFIKIPDQRGEVTILKVLETPAGKERDLMIKNWCCSVWQAFQESHDIIASLVKAELGI